MGEVIYLVQWTEEQLEAIQSKGSNILVAAAAGSGKTAVLVERIIQKLLDKENPINIDEMLVATFTNAAAEEMRNRISQALELAIQEDPQSFHLRKQLSLIQRSFISTLHSFCTTVVRQHAYLLDIDPAFRIADEMEIDLIKQAVIDEMFEAAYGASSKGDNGASDDEEQMERMNQFFHVVDMFSNDRSDIDVETLILSVYTFAMQHPSPKKWLDKVADAYDIPEVFSGEELPWLEILKTEIVDQLEGYRGDLNKAIQLANGPNGPYHYVEALQADILLIDEMLENINCWDELYTLVNSRKLKSLSRKSVDCDEVIKEEIKQLRDRFRTYWNKMGKDWFARNLAGHIGDLRKLYPSVNRIVQLVLEFKERFKQEKKARGLVDFADLEHFCLEILTEKQQDGDQIIPSSIAMFYQKQFKEVLVDEYQDINLVQETILRMVSDQTGNGNMFMVGDVKQSIYRFRHAEPSLFIEKYNRYEKDPSLGMRIDLASNFRSRQTVLQGANFIFKQIFDEAVGNIAYDEKAALQYGNKGYDDLPIHDPEIEVVVIDKEGDSEQSNYDDVDDGEEKVEDLLTIQMEARLYAEKIKHWIGNKNNIPRQIFDKDLQQMRDIQYRDIVILLRSLTGLSTIMEELKKQGIPVYVEMKTGYFSAMEIQVMVNMLKVIDNPYQDIPLASILRSPIVGLNEEQLANVRLMNQKGTFYEALMLFAKTEQDGSELVSSFLKQLSEFREMAKSDSVSALIWEIFQETGYYDFVGGIPGGRQRQANLRALYDRARSYEATSFRGLFRFLRFIERMQEQRKDLGEARALSEQEDVVRIMTIHKSKGLEFPVVMIGGMNKQFNFSDVRNKYMLDKDIGFATKFIDPEKQIMYSTLYFLALKEVSIQHLLSEEMRVLYVAMTRAREKLVMIGTVANFADQLSRHWGNSGSESSLVISKQLRKRAKTYFDWIIPALIRHKNNDVLHRVEDVEIVSGINLKADESTWDIHILDGGKLTNLTEDEVVSKSDLREMMTNWQGVPSQLIDEERVLEIDEKLSFKYPFFEATITRAKQSVTEIKRRQEEIDENSSHELVRGSKISLVSRPKFLQEEKKLTSAEIGTAMHTVMQHLPLTDKWQKEDLAGFVKQLVAKECLTSEEAEVIDLKAIEQFFQHEKAEVFSRAEKIEREVPFMYTLKTSEIYHDWESDTEEKVLIQGIIDCLIYMSDGRVIILDYKTDQINDKDVTDSLITTLKERYRVQIKLYRQAMCDILGIDEIDAYLYFFAKDLFITM